MALKASIIRIIAAHFSSLWLVFDVEPAAPKMRRPRGAREVGIALLDLAVLLLLPFVFSFVLVRHGFYPANEVIGWIVSFVSLTSGLLFSVLVLLFSGLDRTISSLSGKEWRLSMLEQLGGNVLFAVVVGFSVALGFALSGMAYANDSSPETPDIPMPLATLSLGLFFVFILHLGVVLKRTHGLFVDTLHAARQQA